MYDVILSRLGVVLHIFFFSIKSSCDSLDSIQVSYLHDLYIAFVSFVINLSSFFMVVEMIIVEKFEFT